MSAAAALVAGLITAVGAGPAQAAEPLVLPTPQSINYTGADIPLNGDVVVVADADVNDEGYVVATGTVSGQPTVLLEGTTELGLFYAVDTFDQLVVDGVMAGAQVRDWPLMPIRGAIEGFYGIPWSHQGRLDQLDFYGEHKMNTYIYTPKDDPYLRAQWRTLYPEAELDLIAELVQRAKDNHVEFIFALSPGNDICYSRQSDYDAAIAKFEQLRQIGVTQMDDDKTAAAAAILEYGRYEFEGEFVGTDGQKWRVECDTAASGRNGCRAYRMTTVYHANPLETGGYTFGQTNEWVFNNIVLFGKYAR